MSTDSDFKDNLLPFKKFFETYAPKEGWTTRKEAIIPLRLNKRLRIIEEDSYTDTIPSAFLEIDRHEVLAEQYIYDAEVDTAEFAQEVFNSPLGDNLSINDMRAIIDVFQKYIDEWKIKTGSPD